MIVVLILLSRFATKRRAKLFKKFQLFEFYFKSILYDNIQQWILSEIKSLNIHL